MSAWRVIIVLPLVATLARAQPPELAQLVQISAIQGVLRIEPAESYVPSLRPMVARGPEGQWQLGAVRASRAAAPAILSLVRTAGATRTPDQYWTISINALSDQISITAARAQRTPHAILLRMIQRGDKSVRISIVDAEAPGAPTTVDAANLLELRARHPRLVQKYVVPLLLQLAGQDLLLPGAADVYRTFDELEPDPHAVQMLQQIIPELSAPSSSQRRSASQALQQLGAPGVCAALHVDRSSLEPEALTRLDAFVESQSRRRFDDPQAMRDDLSFLADCMEFSSDERVCAAARTRFEQLTRRSIPPADWAHPADFARGQIAARLGR